MNSRLAITIVACCAIACSSRKDVEFQQYFNRGEDLYTKNCSNCHQGNGTGLGKLYPPVNKSDYIDQNFEKVICIMKYGKNDTTIVNGVVYSQPMKGIASLTELEIAEIATFLYNNWDRKRGQVSVEEVAPILENCRP